MNSNITPTLNALEAEALEKINFANTEEKHRGHGMLIAIHKIRDKHKPKDVTICADTLEDYSDVFSIKVEIPANVAEKILNTQKLLNSLKPLDLEYIAINGTKLNVTQYDTTIDDNPNSDNIIHYADDRYFRYDIAYILIFEYGVYFELQNKYDSNQTINIQLF